MVVCVMIGLLESAVLFPRGPFVSLAGEMNDRDRRVLESDQPSGACTPLNYASREPVASVGWFNVVKSGTGRSSYRMAACNRLARTDDGESSTACPFFRPRRVGAVTPSRTA